MIKEMLKPFKFIFNLVRKTVKVILGVPAYLANLVWKGIKDIFTLVAKLLNKLWKAVKYFWAWLVEAFIETLNQLWTLLGMFAAWLVLEGSAKAVVGYAIIITLILWLITIRIRD
jgi:hypothetical protein